MSINLFFFLFLRMTNASSKSFCARVILSMLIEGSRHDVEDDHFHVVFSSYCCLLLLFVCCSVDLWIIIITRLILWLTPEILYVYNYRCICDQISKEIQSVDIRQAREKDILWFADFDHFFSYSLGWFLFFALYLFFSKTDEYC